MKTTDKSEVFAGLGSAGILPAFLKFVGQAGCSISPSIRNEPGAGKMLLDRHYLRVVPGGDGFASRQGFGVSTHRPRSSIVTAFIKEQAAMRTERRKAVRHPFVARAEIIDEKENARTSSKISDLSLNGCFVEIGNPFPEGTSLCQVAPHHWLQRFV